MYAIVDIAGQQFRVEKGQEIYVHRLQGEKGSPVDFHRVLFIENKGKSTIGTPNIEGAGVKGVILDHLKADKLFVFKKKRRKGYKKFNGHRQYLSLIRIEDILETGVIAITEEKKKAAPKKEPKAEKTEVKEAAAGEKPAEAKASKPTKAAKPAKADKTPKTVKAEKKPAAEKEPKKAAPKKKAVPKAKASEKKPAAKTAKKDKGAEKKGKE